MCPPHIGSIDEINKRFKRFQRGVLLQYSKSLDVRRNRKGVEQTKKDFHERILKLEEFLYSEGITNVWGMIGGSCSLCEICKARFDEPCPHPEKARTSLESLSIDVLGLLQQCGLDNKFHPDKITWTGCILFSEKR
jgi:predicted metal-binding protein